MTQQIDDTNPSRSRFLRSLIAFFLILATAVVMFRVMSRMRKRPKKKSTAKALSLRVTASRVQYKPLTLHLKGFGTAEPERRLELVPQVSGKVTYTVRPAFKVGTYVKRGKTLLVIDRSDYRIEYKRLKITVSSVRKQIKIAERAYKVSRVNLGRSLRLVRRRALDQASYERAQQQVLDRGQRLESLRQALRVNEVLLQRASLNLRRTALRAPFNARISRGNLMRGTFVSMGRPIGTIESVDAVEIPVAFSLDALRKMSRPGGGVVPLGEIPTYLKKLPAVRVQAGGFSWKGKVKRTAAGLDRSTRTLTLYVSVELKGQSKVATLLPGTFCRVSIPARQLEKAIALPRRALYGRDTLYLVKAGKIDKQKVKVAYLDNETVIVTEGLRSGDAVIVSQLADPIVGTPVFASYKGGK